MKLFSPTPLTLGDWLSSILEEHKIKAIKFADKIGDDGVDRSTVHHWLKNTRFIDDNKVLDVATFLSELTGDDIEKLERDITWKRYLTKIGRAQ